MDILKEVKEAEKESFINSILTKSAVALFVIGCGVVGYLGFNSWLSNAENERMEEDGVTLSQAVNKINYNKPKNQSEDEKQKLSDLNKVQLEKLEKLASGNSSGYAALSNIYLASLALMDGNPSKAIYYYQRIVKDDYYSSNLREYVNLVAINATLQFNKGVYDSPMSQIKDYFIPYINDKGEIDVDKLKNHKSFSNAMALTGIAIENETSKFDNSNIYLTTIKNYEGDNENVNFIKDMLSIYISQNEKK